MRIGIPRALLYHAYNPLWETFFASLDHEVVTSGMTTKATLDMGVHLAVEETCLPVKIYYGHCAELVKSGVDTVFVPRLVSVEPRAFICPKFMGLPDMIRHAIRERDRILDVTVDLRRRPRLRLWQAARQVGDSLRAPQLRVMRAFAAGLTALHAAETARYQEQGTARRSGSSIPSIGLLGHPYNVHDPLLNMNLRQQFSAAGYRVLTPETVPPSRVEAGARTLPKELFWTYGRRVYGAAEDWMKAGKVRGVVHVVSFGCGPDSLVGELVERRARVLGVPFLLLTLDEHTGEAGVKTRVEAFLDMLSFRERRVAESRQGG